MEVERYLKRIHVNRLEAPSLSFLSRLQDQHMLHVPFENLDVIRQVPIELHIPSFYDKVVLRRRGGFCYELNGLFHWLLGKAGYEARLISATVKQPDGDWALEDSHAAIIVCLDGSEYLVDVGFGDSTRRPLRLSGEVSRDVSGDYRVDKCGKAFYLQRKKDDSEEWQTLYRFLSRGRKLDDFHKACEYNQTSPSSPFTGKDIATIASADGRLTISGNTLIQTTRFGRERTGIEEEEKKLLLQNEFGMSSF
ncbi:arylamine N-acetyltransferase [Halobacillus sp. ACCC02827]|uniref:arylamine N-acetyltransferase family protein n=1 Tax=Halobacillus sp. ACCC02827 TaxID=3052090 RepID=UPI0025701E92|nr:arylamine N-acetyltransferase [Halobacillus sp. ACCC02827]WJE17317.1 arylamine N-acetyltransferase [Halobacillus sp. ACCC02827]